jgi:hypothetical protein
VAIHFTSTTKLDITEGARFFFQASKLAINQSLQRQPKRSEAIVMKNHESRWVPINSAIAVVMLTAAMSAFIDLSYSDAGIPEEGVVEAVDTALADSMRDQSLVCMKPGAIARAERISP